jgi:hypothetical protein
VSNAHTVKVILVFADQGAFHREHVDVPAASLDRYDTLIDCLREDPEVLMRVHLDAGRLCAAFVADRA